MRPASCDKDRMPTESPSEAALPQPPVSLLRYAHLVIAAAVLVVAAVLVSGSTDLGAPWIQGDEQIFIATNPDVTGEGQDAPLWARWWRIFAHPHEDLYQPFTILTYAIEWQAWGDQRVFYMRLTDVLLHALNALLLWAALAMLLRRIAGAPALLAVGVAWPLAFIWAVHPVLVTAYAADMGRTHLLAATFLLPAAMCHLRALDFESARERLIAPLRSALPAGRAAASASRIPIEIASEAAVLRRAAWGWFAASLLLLLLSMLNKPMVGWVAVVLMLEAALLGWRPALRSPRAGVVLTVCVFFSVLTIWTTRRSLTLEDSPLPLFGDPVARAALSIFIYLRNFVAPGPWLATWYPPDIHTGWAYWRVWAGALITLLAAVVAVLAWRKRETRGVTVGLVWFWAMWLPISGLVGARVAAAQDRYLYQPMIGLLLVLGVLMIRLGAARSSSQRQLMLAVGSVAALLGAAAIPWNVKIAAHARSTLQRAAWAVERNIGDPRVYEMLAAAYAFGRNHHTMEDELPEPPNWTASLEAALARAAELARERPEYFRDAHDRAAFHRRLSYQYWELGQEYERLFTLAPLGGAQVNRLLTQLRDAGYRDEDLLDLAQKRFLVSLDEAQAASKLEPDHKLTWVRLAHAYRSLGRWEDALRAFERLEQVLPATAPDWAIRYTDFGTLLLYTFNDPQRAKEKFQAALRHPGITPEARTVATIGLARCEIMAGEGIVGYQLIRKVLADHPGNAEAQRVLALYLLRSHRFDEARETYASLLNRNPLDYPALQGFHEACAQTGHWQAAADAWRRAASLAPGEPTFAAFWVWSLACGGAPDAALLAESLLDSLPDNPFACYALMLTALREGRVRDALAWARLGARGESIPAARDHARAEATLRLLIEEGRLPPEAVLVHAALLAEFGQVGQAQAAVELYLAARPDSPWVEEANRVIAATSQPVTRPATGEIGLPVPTSAPASPGG